VADRLEKERVRHEKEAADGVRAATAAEPKPRKENIGAAQEDDPMADYPGLQDHERPVSFSLVWLCTVVCARKWRERV